MLPLSTVNPTLKIIPDDPQAPTEAAIATVDEPE